MRHPWTATPAEQLPTPWRAPMEAEGGGRVGWRWYGKGVEVVGSYSRGLCIYLVNLVKYDVSNKLWNNP